MRLAPAIVASMCASVLLLVGCSSSAPGEAAAASAASVVNDALPSDGPGDADAADAGDLNVSDEGDGASVASDAPGPAVDFCTAVSAAEFEAIFGVPVETTEAAVVAGAQLGGCTLTSAFDPEKPMTMAMVAARSDDFDELVSFYAEGGSSVTVSGATDAWFNPTTGVLVRGDGGFASYQLMGSADLMSGAVADEAASIAVAEAFLN